MAFAVMAVVDLSLTASVSLVVRAVKSSASAVILGLVSAAVSVLDHISATVMSVRLFLRW